MKKPLFIYLLLMCFVLCLASSCKVYDKHELSQYKIQKLDNPDQEFYIIDDSNYDAVWKIEAPVLKNYAIYGNVNKLYEKEVVFLKRENKFGNRKLKNCILLHIPDQTVLKVFESDSIALDLAEVQKAEVYEINQGKTALVNSLDALIAPSGFLFLLFLLAILL